MIAVIAMAIHMRFRKKSQKFTGLVATLNEDSVRKGERRFYAFSLMHKSLRRYTIPPHSAPRSAQGIPKISLVQGTSKCDCLR